MAGNVRGKIWEGLAATIAAVLLTAAMLMVVLFAAAPARRRAPLTIQDPGTYVVDTAHVLDGPTKERLENLLAELNSPRPIRSSCSRCLRSRARTSSRSRSGSISFGSWGPRRRRTAR